MSVQAIITLVILILTLVALITNKVSLASLGGLLIGAFIITKVLTVEEAVSPFANTTLILMSITFMLSAAFLEVGLANKVGNAIVKIVGGTEGKASERKVLAVCMLAVIIMCLFLPHFAVIAVLLPVFISTAMVTGYSRTRIIFVATLASSFGGSITLIGSTVNMLAKSYFEEQGLGTFGFFEFAWAGLPVAVVGFIVMLLFYKKLTPETIVETVSEQSVQVVDEKEHPKWKQRLVGILFVLFILSIITSSVTKISYIGVGIFIICALVFAKCLPEKKALGSIDISTVIFMVGVIDLASALEKTGVSAMIANGVLSLIGQDTSPYVILTILFVLGAFLTQITSNVAAAGILFPIGVALATALGADVKAITLAICIACCSSFMTPLATTVNTMIMGPAKLTFNDWLKAGWPFMIITYLACIIVLPLVYPFFG